MCEYCKKEICPSACPAYTGNGRESLGLIGICFWCGSRIRRGDPFQFKNNKFFCGDCAVKARLTPRYT